jgi:hypothetical protein
MESKTLQKFREIDGIELINCDEVSHDYMVQVKTESAVGKFFKIKRESSSDFSHVTRSTPIPTVLDAWLDV